MVYTSRRQTQGTFGDVLAAAKNGDEWAWRTIYTGLASPVTGYLAARGADDPDDLAGEVFLQVARDISRFEGDEPSFRSWVFVIAHRRLIDYRRSQARRPKTADMWPELTDRSIGGNVEEEAIDDLTINWVREVLDVLTDEQRSVLALRVIADLTLEETANVMGKRVGAVKALQRRALTAVRAHIEEGRVTL